MGYVSIGMGDCFSALLVSLMAFGLAIGDRDTFKSQAQRYLGSVSPKDLAQT